MAYWLFKSEPHVYPFERLRKEKVTSWEGVRNFQARNLLRDEIKAGDGVLFYHSNTEPPAVVGTARVVREGYPDHTAWERGSKNYDPRSTPENPIWYTVDIAYEQAFLRPVTRDQLKAEKVLQGMALFRYPRLSVSPVRPREWELICRMGGP